MNNSSPVSVNKRVLILYTHRQMSPINTQWHSGIIEAIRRDYHGPIDIDVEYMDVVLQSDLDYFQQWAALLKRKYAKYPPDVVIPVFFPAVTFLLPNRDDFFPNCPIVFCAIPEAFGTYLAKRENLTGVGFIMDFDSTVGVIRKLLPKTSKLLILSGSSKMDQWFKNLAWKGISSRTSELELVDLSGLSPTQAAEEISRAGSDAAALLLTYEVDKQNNRYNTTEYLQDLKKLSAIPIFGCYDTLLGQGIVGGALISPVEQGQIAGRLAARILNGESADQVPEVLDRTYNLAFDGEVLETFGIPESRLPEGSKIINRKPNMWSQYGRYIASGLAALLAQSAIIVSLLINRKKRIAAEKEARSLAGRILSAGEDERRYLARELHDDVSQRLAAVSIETGSLENKLSNSTEIKESLEKLKKSLKSICDDLHRMSRHMHPSVLDDFGLPDALKSECTELSQRWGIPIECHYTKSFPEIPKSIALCLYRVAQESLWNAVRHSSSSKITVELKSDPEFVYLDIKDDGKGFDLNLTQPNRGLGLASMTERIRLVDGTIKIDTAPSQGVSIAVVVPIPESTDSLSTS
ncbi:MAG: histidine kinase [Planctomycetaceae bacterium]|nr:histidine kinase [Planctomycetaceae bacterium]